ncbi:hypothetical protein CLV24_11439 [Pontibacter ummariensis]|uniref:Uncharacterized protein n=1 Tax=Pontibacter ummariensis TaxID=1610492 RepID=A0A239HKV8_9BACT|nr:hypothetical protein [Pontibacter ummariensis]PRY10311.1 hypothetical protein CLV24_11439 [Pontibacter ummariensis]SNS81977.1 hypothetical protein SAMN06296052_11439 [Pontibacter ummariensis]
MNTADPKPEVHKSKSIEVLSDTRYKAAQKHAAKLVLVSNGLKITVTLYGATPEVLERRVKEFFGEEVKA